MWVGVGATTEPSRTPVHDQILVHECITKMCTPRSSLI